MISEIKYRWRLNRLYAKQNKTVRLYDKCIKKAKAEGEKREEIEILKSEESGIFFEIQDEIQSLITSHLANVAQRHFLPVPDRNDDDMWNKFGYRKVLTDKGISQIRKTIRREKKERRDTYMPWIAAFTGLIGALTGLLAIILK